MAEVLVGKDKNEQLIVSTNKTQAYGLSGNDTLISDNKSDVLLIGGSGDDSLIMTGGVGTLNGGKGNDTFEFTYSKDKKISAVIEDLDPASDKIVVNFDGDTAPQLSSLKSGNDVVWKDSDGLFNLTLKGVRENDYFDGNASEEVWEILRLTNDEREKENLPALTLSEGLTEGATIRVEEINQKGALGALSDHTRLDNETSWLTVFDEIGKSYVKVGENLDGGARSPEDVMNDWRSSESHKENILNSDYKKLGVAYKNDDPDPSNQRFYWVQWFAKGFSSTERETISTENLLTANIDVNTISSLFVSFSEGNDTYSNEIYGSTLNALDGNDSITNTGLIASISGGAGADTITNSGSFVTINAGKDNDLIQLGADSAAKNVFIQYAAGDGNDTITGLNSTDTVSISSNDYTATIIGNDVVVAVGADSITLLDAINSGVQVYGAGNPLIVLSGDVDSYSNTAEDAMILNVSGNNSVYNWGANSTIEGSSDNDIITNYSSGENASVNGNAGNDIIVNNASQATINGGTDDDFIGNAAYGSFTEINAGTGNDYVENKATNVFIDSGDGNDDIDNYGSSVTITADKGNNYVFNESPASNALITAGGGSDTIGNLGSYTTIKSGEGNDSVGSGGNNVLIDVGIGTDSVRNYGASSTIDAGDDDDYLYNQGDNTSINAGDGDDYIDNGEGLNINIEHVTIETGDGDDYINNYACFHAVVKGGNGKDTIENSVSSFYATISGGEGDDSIVNVASFGGCSIEGDSGNDFIYSGGFASTINGGEGDDTIQNTGFDASINGDDGDDIIASNDSSVTAIGGAGNDSIYNYEEGSNTSIVGGDGNDYIESYGDTSTLNGGAGDDYIENSGTSASIVGGEGSNEIWNYGINSKILGGESKDYIWNNAAASFATINGGAGDDQISNGGDSVIINGEVGDDYIYNIGSQVTINGGKGDDAIRFNSDAEYNLIQYNSGDGSDTISGFKETDTLRVICGTDTYSTQTKGEDIIINVGTNSITLEEAASLSKVNIEGLESIESEAVGDTFRNKQDGAVVQGLAGNDSIYNTGVDVSINAGAGNDYIHNNGENLLNGANNVTIDGGKGDDTIDNNHGASVSIDGGEGNDYIENNYETHDTTINGGKGDDQITLESYSGNILIKYKEGDGNDTIWNFNADDTLQIGGGKGTYSTQTSGADVLVHVGNGNINLKNVYMISDKININGDVIALEMKNIVLTNGKDDVTVRRDSILVNAGAGDDSISNDDDENVTINGGKGDDSIYNSSDANHISINGGAGNDSIHNYGSDVTIEGGKDNDTIYNDDYSDYGSNVLFKYKTGDGNDIITGFNETSTLLIDNGTYSTQTSGVDVLVKVGNGTVNLKNVCIINDAININGENISIGSISLTSDNDSIRIGRDSISIDGGAGDDTISSSGNAVTIIGGKGNDQISLSSDAQNNLIIYKAGDGNDIITGFNSTSTLKIGDGTGTYSTVQSGSDILIAVGNDTITLKNAYQTAYTIHINGDNIALERENISLTGGHDSLYVLEKFISVYGGVGNDTIINLLGDNNTIDGGAGDDSISNYSQNVLVYGGVDNDYIDNRSDGKNVTISGDAGNDRILNYVVNVTIDGGADNDIIRNYGASSTILGGDGNDSIYNETLALWDDEAEEYYETLSPEKVTINGGAGKDFIENKVENVTISGDDGGDDITNNATNVSISGGSDNDIIRNYGASSIIDGGAGNDTINNYSTKVTIKGGKDDDVISLASDSKNTFIQYSPGDGNDTVWGLTKNDTLQIGNGKSTYSTEKKGDDVIVHVGTGSITLKNFRDNPKHIIIGESGTSGGGSGGSGGGSPGGSGGGGSGGSSGGGSPGGSTSGGSGGSSGGTSSGYGGGYSASGSSGSGSTSSSSNGSSSGRGNTDTKKTSSSTVKKNSVSDNQTVQNRRESKTFTYSGGRRTVSNYQNGDKILFSAEYTGSYYDGAGNFVVGSSSGSLLVKSAVDKVIDLSNANGIPSIKAYAASNEGVIDGRGIAGFEIINGSNGADMTYAGDGGSSLWGGNGFASDTLVGGAGVDSFICSKNQGADLVLNAAPKDTIYFNDATLSDIVSATENNLAISITFNTGNVVTVRSPEFLSAKFALADGNAYRFNHIARNWQKA